jgi:hypothetical protein
VKVKLQREAESSPKDGATTDGGDGADDRSASPDHDEPGPNSEDADADGEADTQASDDVDDSESDPFEVAETGRKRPPWGPPAGAEHRRRKHGGGGEADIGVGPNKRLHTDETEGDLDEHDQAS